MTDTPASADPEDVVNFRFEEVVDNRRHDPAPVVFHPQMKIRRMGVQAAVRHLLAAGPGGVRSRIPAPPSWPRTRASSSASPRPAAGSNSTRF